MTIQEIGRILKERREFLQLRQEDLGELGATTARTIHQIESGTGNPSLKTLEKLATVLGMELVFQVKKLMTDDDHRNR